MFQTYSNRENGHHHLSKLVLAIKYERSPLLVDSRRYDGIVVDVCTKGGLKGFVGINAMRMKQKFGQNTSSVRHFYGRKCFQHIPRTSTKSHNEIDRTKSNPHHPLSMRQTCTKWQRLQFISYQPARPKSKYTKKHTTFF